MTGRRRSDHTQEEVTEADATEILDGGAARALGQIVVAQNIRVYRDEEKIKGKLKVLAAEAGDDFYYAFPVKDHATGRTDTIEGVSIKCANNVARLYGNCWVGAAVDPQTMSDQYGHWLFAARFIDLETGYSLIRCYRQRKSQRAMNTKDPERAVDMIFQIGQSKAIRNVIDNALEYFTRFALEEAKASLVDKIGKNLDKTREKILGGLEALQIDVKRVERVLGRVAKDWLARDMARIIAEKKAIDDGMASALELWPPVEPGVGQDEDRPREEAPAEREARVAAENKALEGGAKSGEAAGKNGNGQKPAPQSPPPAAEQAKPKPAEDIGNIPEKLDRRAEASKAAPAAEAPAQAQAAAPASDGDDKPRKLKYQAPVTENAWVEQFVALATRMKSVADLDQLEISNGNELKFVRQMYRETHGAKLDQALEFLRGQFAAQ